MKITLKNVKHAEFASQETHCFSATVYIDGAKAGTVENSGHGGPNSYWPHSVQTQIDTCAKTLPKIKCDFNDDTGQPVMMEVDAEILIGNLVNEFLKQRDLKRLCARKTAYRLKGETYGEGEYLVVNRKFDAAIKAALVKRHGTEIAFLNEEVNGALSS